MAKTIAWCHGHDAKRVKSASRLGSVAAIAEANTFHTFAKVRVNADGSGYVSVERNGIVLHYFMFDKEG